MVRKKDETLTTKEVIAILKSAIAECGTVAKFQAANPVVASYSTQYISDVVNCRRSPGPLILNALGLEIVKEIKYRRWR